jgi:DNA-binding NarL/FixJ family response regulator
MGSSGIVGAHAIASKTLALPARSAGGKWVARQGGYKVWPPPAKQSGRRMGMSKSDPTIIIADDHPLFRVTLRLLVRSIAPQASIVEADSFDSLKRAATANPAAELALLDLVMPGVEGLSSLQFLRGGYPHLRVAVISSLSQQILVREVRALGAAACIHKSIAPEQLRAALRKLLAGGDWWPQYSPPDQPGSGDDGRGGWPENLSRQEREILLYLDQSGLSRRIAEDLHISESAVKLSIGAILHKLGLGNAAHSAAGRE